MSKSGRVQNKAPAPVQITAEQILRDVSHLREKEYKPPLQGVADLEELQDYRLRKRKEFEDNIRKNRNLASNWVKYGQWEESQKDFPRARSVFERSLAVDYKNPSVWLRYAEMEMKNGFVNHARNIWDRAVTLLPRVDQFWYKYAYMEEMLENVAGARQVFMRWMDWAPGEQAWLSFIKMELRHNNVENARRIYEKFVYTIGSVKSWLKYAKFEEKVGRIDLARNVFERAVEFYGDQHPQEWVFLGFAQFEERCREHERARAIYRFALDKLPKGQATTLYKEYVTYEKKFGDKDGIENVITQKRRIQYDEEVAQNPHSYDTWFDYVRLEEENGDEEKVRDVYERAVACVPPVQEKRLWRRYIYLWIYYAVYEELNSKDMERARQIYKTALRIIPHQDFTFAKIWIMYAHFEIRQMNISDARKALGTAIGLCPKNKLFREYIAMEMQIGNIDRCRSLHEKYVEFSPENTHAWNEFADLEISLGEIERARALFELAVAQPTLDMPEAVWKAYIDMELEQEEWENVRQLYERLLEKTKHVKVWMSYAKAEVTAKDYSRARTVFDRAHTVLMEGEKKAERVTLLRAWKDFENEFGSEEQKKEVEAKMPEVVAKKRPVFDDNGNVKGHEHYNDFVFPEEKTSNPQLKIMQMAQMWKMGASEDAEE
uniref:Crooked neck protein n=2 Tax=Palpitomonas bilix TaxID=652834 RepID=A0A7S3DDB3_9EUKA|mmetsp:Transcript_31809/g.83040  ORF Transcript_31809/g.83040 Transcript_31809/m.83040 type:complete len:660 (+) Transcript_31809:369-2348(+)